MIIMGDFNAKVGKGRVGEYNGPHGFGERHERIESLTDFAPIQIWSLNFHQGGLHLKITNRHP